MAIATLSSKGMAIRIIVRIVSGAAMWMSILEIGQLHAGGLWSRSILKQRIAALGRLRIDARCADMKNVIGRHRMIVLMRFLR